MRLAGYVARMAERRGVYRFLAWKREEKKPLGKYRRRLEDNIKMDLQKVGCGSTGWIDPAQDRKGMWHVRGAAAVYAGF